MELNNFFSLVVGVISFAVILYISDLVVTRIFSRLDDDLAESNFDEATKRKKINLIIGISIVFLIGVIIFVNANIRIPEIPSRRQVKDKTEIALSEIPPSFAKNETEVSFASQEPDTTSLPSDTPTPVIDSDLEGTQQAAEETIQARDELATQNALATKNAQATQTSAAATAQAKAARETLEAAEFPKVKARKTTSNELDSIPSIWIEYGLDAEIESETYQKKYLISISSSDVYRLPFRWCATSKEILDKNLNEISLEFLIDDISLSESQIGEFDYKASDRGVDWECRRYSTTLYDWESGTNVELIINAEYPTDIFDGNSVYKAGTYILGLFVFVD